ncbi:hypothetical protein [Caballeronia telluris]|uniref:Uncharacterized protein n=1 Tax=Caballeronia telluris TaxID=326475 RepID=A0A158H199_9BURK|nr:hypothetical protein [Caballeronia telluris]SAL37897.1 hypothetical protein AWB66_01942 [Caballeronia telluris]
MAIELKTDSWHRYMLYRGDEPYMTYDPEDARRLAAEAGKKFTALAYADVWAKDSALVKRVRRFLRENFHWHARLAERGSDLEVTQTLMVMVRGGSVAVIPEEPMRSCGIGCTLKQADSSLRDVENYGETPYASVTDRYQAQLERIDAERPTWAETDALMDEINADFLQKTIGSSPLLDSFFRAAGWTEKYSDAGTARASLFEDVQPFEYDEASGILGGDADIQTAWLPITGGPPGTWVENPSGSGQLRLFDVNGNAAVDIDFDHDHGFGVPHSHNWDNGVRDNGNRVSLLPY